MDTSVRVALVSETVSQALFTTVHSQRLSPSLMSHIVVSQLDFKSILHCA